MVLTAENQSTRSKTSSTTTLSATNPTRTGLGRKPGLPDGRPATSLVSVVVMNPSVKIVCKCVGVLVMCNMYTSTLRLP